jgi:hypothetical protein
MNKNTYYSNKYMDEKAGIDERVLNDEVSISDKELMKIFYKKSVLDKLSSHNYSVDEKHQMIIELRFFEEKLNTEDIKPFNSKNGGLMNDWNFEEF